jgi:hypothetical protein
VSSDDRLVAVIESLSESSEAPDLTLAPTIDRRRTKDNEEKRIENWQRVFEESDGDQLPVLHNALDRIKSYIGRIKVSPSRILTSFEAHSLMIEQLAITTVSEALKARRLQIREIVFKSITASLTKSGARDPENTNADLPVPALGKRFVREGCGYNDSEVDYAYLKANLDEDEWKRFIWVENVPEQVIPAHEVERHDRDALAEFLEQNPKRLPVIKAATTRGAPKSPRYTVKDISDDDADGPPS